MKETFKETFLAIFCVKYIFLNYGIFYLCFIYIFVLIVNNIESNITLHHETIVSYNSFYNVYFYINCMSNIILSMLNNIYIKDISQFIIIYNYTGFLMCLIIFYCKTIKTIILLVNCLNIYVFLNIVISVANSMLYSYDHFYYIKSLNLSNHFVCFFNNCLTLVTLVTILCLQLIKIIYLNLITQKLVNSFFIKLTLIYYHNEFG